MVPGGQWEQEGGSHKVQFKSVVAFSVFCLHDNLSQNAVPGEWNGEKITRGLTEKDSIWDVSCVKLTEKKRGGGGGLCERKKSGKKERCFRKQKSKDSFLWKTQRCFPIPFLSPLKLARCLQRSALLNSLNEGWDLLSSCKSGSLTSRNAKRKCKHCPRIDCEQSHQICVLIPIDDTVYFLCWMWIAELCWLHFAACFKGFKVKKSWTI